MPAALLGFSQSDQMLSCAPCEKCPEKGTIAVFKVYPIGAVLISCSLALLPNIGLAGDAGAPPADPRAIAKDYYVSCQWRVAQRFMAEPTIRDFRYKSGDMTVPAREFSVEQGMDRYKVTVADFTNGPAVDDTIVENAVMPMRQLGEIEEQQPEDYAPGLPGRQLVIFAPNGRQYRFTVYMADHHLYISEAYTARGDFKALQFDQSMVLIGADGADQNNFGNPLHYPCEK